MSTQNAFALTLALLLSSCSNETHSSLNVTNGRTLTNSEWPSVVQTFNGGGSCTGTFIRHNILLTARHCVTYPDAVWTYRNGKAVKSLAIIQNPRLPDVLVGPTDLALVVYSDQTAPALSEICNRPARRGQKVFYVGFGRDGLANESSKGIKRFGSNTVEAAAGGLVHSVGKSQATNNDGTDATVASGDSGGPLFDAATECVLGVASGANESESFHASVVTGSFDWVDFIINQRPNLQASLGADPELLQAASEENTSPSSRFESGW